MIYPDLGKPNIWNVRLSEKPIISCLLSLKLFRNAF